MFELRRYKTPNGRVPLSEWMREMKDKIAQARIRARLRQLESGNFGDYEPVGEGVLELRIHVGAGYRVYFGRHGIKIVVLLCAGDKRSQQADIKRAKAMWSDWKEREL